MTHNYAPNKAEPGPGQGLIKEQCFTELNSSVMKLVHAITRRYNLIAPWKVATCVYLAIE